MSEFVSSVDRLYERSEVISSQGEPHYALWKRRFWPYNEVQAGDTLYFYHSPSTSIFLKTVLAEVDCFQYATKEELIRRLEDLFPSFSVEDLYFKKKMDVPRPCVPGYCVATKVASGVAENLGKPATLKVPRLGWLRVDDKIRREWLLQPALPNVATVLTELRRLSEQMKSRPARKVHALLELLIRQDAEIVRKLKELCGYQCQFPECGQRILKRDGGFYIEAHHVKPVAKGGQSTLGNLVILCPNHHKEFHYGELRIILAEETCLKGMLNGTDFSIPIPGTKAI